MKLRYCPLCRRKVGKKLTIGQLWLTIALYGCLIVPGIVYSIKHTKKCPICGAPTSQAFEKKEPATAKGKKK